MNKYEGMTVNERLQSSGLLDEYDAATLESDVEKVKSLLKQVELSDEAISQVLKYLGL